MRDIVNYNLAFLHAGESKSLSTTEGLEVREKYSSSTPSKGKILTQ